MSNGGWVRTRRRALLAALLTAAACDAPRPPPTDAATPDALPPPPRWTCPPEWVPAEHGGCGPAVLLCAPGGGAAPDAPCAAIDLARPRPVTDPDGETGATFYRDAAGAIAGAWPAADFAPTAGIPTCPEGWRRTPDDVCDPVLRTDCPAGSEPLPGGLCTPTSERDCPASGEYPPAPGGRPAVYVRADADGSIADGSAARPFRTITAGIAHAYITYGPAAPYAVLVGAGTYAERVQPHGDAVIAGVCAARATIRGDGVSAESVRVATGGYVLDLSGFTLTGVRTALLVDGTNVRARARALRVEGAGVIAVSARIRAQLELSDSVVARTVLSRDGLTGNALQANYGGVLVARRVALVANPEAAVTALEPGSRVELYDSLVRGTTPRRNGDAGNGLWANSRSAIEATRTVIEDNTGVAGAVAQTGARVALTDVIVRRQRPAAAGSAFGRGVIAQQGGRVELVRTLVERTAIAGLSASDEGSELLARDSVVRAVQAGDGALRGRGVQVQLASRAALDRVVLAPAAAYGVVVREGAMVTARDVRIADLTRPPGGASYSIALSAADGGVFDAARLLVADAPDVGVSADGPDARGSIVDSVVRGAGDTSSDQPGYGLVAARGGALRAARLRVERTRVGGVLAFEGGHVTAHDVRVADVVSTPRGMLGRGLSAHGVLEIRRALVHGVREIGAYALSPQGQLALTDVIIEGVAPSARGFGLGVAAYGAGRVEAERLAVRAVHGAGLVATPQLGTESSSTLLARDLYLRDVAPSTLRFDGTGETSQPTGRTASYALHTWGRCAIDVTQVTLRDAEYGFFASAASLRMQRGSVAGMRAAFGVANGVAPGEPVLESVDRRANAVNDTLRDVELVETAALPLPEPLCPMDGCL